MKLVRTVLSVVARGGHGGRCLGGLTSKWDCRCDCVDWPRRPDVLDARRAQRAVFSKEGSRGKGLDGGRGLAESRVETRGVRAY